MSEGKPSPADTSAGADRLEIVPGVVRVARTRGSNVYLVRGERVALIDTGLPGNAGAVAAGLNRLGLRAADVAAVFVTHWHRDHTGSLGAVRTATGGRTLAHRADAVLRGDGPPGGLLARSRWLLRTLSGWPVVDGVVDDGQVFPEFRGLTVLHTPGHTAGSICLWLPMDGVLFTGDTVLSNGDRLSRPLPGPGTNGGLLEHSVKRLAALDARVVAAGHGPPVSEGAAEMLRRLAARPPDPLPLRVVKNWRRLLRFSHDMHRRRP